MLVLEHDGIEIDCCYECAGIWLDEGELELLSGVDGRPSAVAGALAKDAAVKGKGKRRCPVCSKRMFLADIDIAGDAGAESKIVEIDKCPKGHGMWFDKGELDDIVAASGGGESVVDFLASLFRG
jgi:Zn-finger nucleic acid-binding protein